MMSDLEEKTTTGPACDICGAVTGLHLFQHDDLEAIRCNDHLDEPICWAEIHDDRDAIPGADDEA